MILIYVDDGCFKFSFFTAIAATRRLSHISRAAIFIHSWKVGASLLSFLSHVIGPGSARYMTTPAFRNGRTAYSRNTPPHHRQNTASGQKYASARARHIHIIIFEGFHFIYFRLFEMRLPSFQANSRCRHYHVPSRI